PDGRRYKMLVAPLILQMDGRVNLNVHGNLMGYTQDPTTNANSLTHRSNQGWGPWEVNPSYVLNEGTATTEWRRIFLRYDNSAPTSELYAPPGGTRARIPGRYDYTTGSRGVAPAGGALSGGNKVRYWSQADYNGARDVGFVGAPSNPVLMPLPGSANAWFASPNSPTDPYANGGSENVQPPQL